MKIYLATWMLEPAQGIELTNTNKRERLLSYFYVKKEQFKRYIKTGKNK